MVIFCKYRSGFHEVEVKFTLAPPLLRTLRGTAVSPYNPEISTHPVLSFRSHMGNHVALALTRFQVFSLPLKAQVTAQILFHSLQVQSSGILSGIDSHP